MEAGRPAAGGGLLLAFFVDFEGISVVISSSEIDGWKMRGRSGAFDAGGGTEREPFDEGDDVRAA
jgi:hypothetical protein